MSNEQENVPKVPLTNSILLKKHRIRTVILSLIAIIIFCSVLRPTLILNNKNFLPLSNAMITYNQSSWNGCVEYTTVKTNSFGIAFFPGLFLPCQLTVIKSGYHTNGANMVNTIHGLFGFRVLFLNKIKNPQTPIMFNRVFKPNSGMDITSYLNDLNPSVSPGDMLGNENNDFTFIQVGTIGTGKIGTNPNVQGFVGEPILSIQFSGNGGVQEVSKDNTGDDAGGMFYDLENLLVVPSSGYSKSLTLYDGKAYIARLKDGKRYMEFYMLGSCMAGFIQPVESQNLEFTNMTNSHLCSSDENSSNYDLKNRYLSLQKELTGKHTIEMGMYYQNRLGPIYIKEYMGTYYFNLASNDGRFSDTHSSMAVKSLSGLLVEVQLPTFDIFSKSFNPNSTQIPIDIFIGGKYLDPTKILLE